MDVPFHAPEREYLELREPIDRAVGEVLASGRYVLGGAVERFEQAAARYLSLPHALGVANGSDALALVLEAMGVGRGDEVIVPPYTFVATAGAVVRIGATPVFADIEPEGMQLDPGAAAAAVTPRTAAIVPVHLFGQLVDTTPFRTLADRYGLALIEDAAQAFGATRSESGSAVGPGHLGDAATFSFYPTKNLAATGDGGLIVTRDDGLAARILSLRNHGRVPDGPRKEAGHNSRLDAIQAAVLEVKLGRLEDWTTRRRENAAAFDAALEDLDGLAPPGRLPGVRHTFHQYAVRCGSTEVRAALLRHLAAAGVGTAVYYDPPLHRTPPFTIEAPCPVAERVASGALCLPVFAHLSREERQWVVASLESFEAV